MMGIRFLDIGTVLKITETKNGYWYVVEGKNGVYRVFSKRYFDVDSVVYVYIFNDRYYISDK
jgi:hypothetical protein